MGHGRHVTSSSSYYPPAPIPPPVPDLIVSGVLTPDITGDYFEAGIYADEPYYRNIDSSWFIWFDGMGYWYINQVLGNEGPIIRWLRESPNPLGNYNPQFGAVGIATVSLP